MKKKSLITMLVTLLLVAVVGVGATLAYLTDTEDVTNTFTVGNVQITLDEKAYNADGRTEEGNVYENLQPGDVIPKDPTVNLVTGSSECYVFVKVDGLSDLLAIKGKDANGNEVPAFSLNKDAYAGWRLWENTENVYVYETTLGNVETKVIKTTPLFKTITFNPDVVEYSGDAKPKIENVVVTAYAIQKKNLTVDQAFSELFE